MPQSAKRLSADTVEIPFPPFVCSFSGGTERWILGRVGSKDNLVFDILWNDRPVAQYTLGAVSAGTYPIHGQIELSGTLYSGVSITLNADTETGAIRFRKAAEAAPDANSR